METITDNSNTEFLIEKTGDVAVAVVPMEELAAENAADFKRGIAPALQANNKLVLDLSAVHFVDSSGLGAILSCLRQLTAKGGDLKLCGMSRPVRSLFELVRMEKIIDIFGSREEAVRAFQT